MGEKQLLSAGEVQKQLDTPFTIRNIMKRLEDLSVMANHTSSKETEATAMNTMHEEILDDIKVHTPPWKFYLFA